MALCRCYGGCSKYIPADSKRGDLHKLIGQAAADAIASRHGGESLTIPNGINIPEPKKTRILELIESGLSVRRIAMDVRCTENWVKILKRQHYKARAASSKGV